MIQLKGSALGDTFHRIMPIPHLNYKLKTQQIDKNNKAASFQHRPQFCRANTYKPALQTLIIALKLNIQSNKYFKQRNHIGTIVPWNILKQKQILLLYFEIFFRPPYIYKFFSGDLELTSNLFQITVNNTRQKLSSTNQIKLKYLNNLRNLVVQKCSGMFVDSVKLIKSSHLAAVSFKGRKKNFNNFFKSIHLPQHQI